MKKLLISSALTLGLISTLNAYELNGDLEVKWTGFKTEKKAPVSGTFNNVKLDIKSSDDLATFLKSSIVTIETKSLESKNPGRNLNITSTLFALSTAKEIKGSIELVDTTKNELILNVVMNEVQKQVPMKYEITEGVIMAKGSIDILDFDMESSYLAFAKKCGALHQNKSFSDVNIEFKIPFK